MEASFILLGVDDVVLVLVLVLVLVVVFVVGGVEEEEEAEDAEVALTLLVAEAAAMPEFVLLIGLAAVAAVAAAVSIIVRSCILVMNMLCRTICTMFCRKGLCTRSCCLLQYCCSLVVIQFQLAGGNT